MADLQTLNQQDAAIQDTSPVVLRIIFGILFAIPGLGGLIMLLVAAFAWMTVGFNGNPSPLDIIMPGNMLVLFSVITTGIVLRYTRWKKAPMVSLWLAIAAIFAIGLAVEALADTLGSGWESRFGAVVVAIPALLIGPLPPFLHWWKAP